ncbi:MAG: hypothetical protein LBU75_03480 [Desulfovibrio sp.]|jgi:hypothetical protein|nr:hypothetical protein [Desulfovibrio sp.]
MTPRILVLGGCGGTGGRIVADLLRLMPRATVDAGGRRPPRHGGPYAPAGGGRWVAASVSATAGSARSAGSAESAGSAGAGEAGEAGADDDGLVALLSAYDFVVLALGPFAMLRTAAHAACIRAGVDCLDINDDPAVAREIMELHEAAGAEGVRVLTGMGVNPGLSTALLYLLAGQHGRFAEAHVRLFAGGNEGAGRASTWTMLHGLSPRVCELRGGFEAWVPADDAGPMRDDVFPGVGDCVPAIHCFSAEAALLELSAARGLPLPADSVTYRMHFQGMPRRMAGVLRRFSAWDHPRAAALTGLFHAMHRMGSTAVRNLARSTLAVRCRGGQGAYTAFATGETTFGLTAAYAAATAYRHLRAPDALPPGVHATTPALPWLRDALDDVAALHVRVATIEGA